MKSWSSPIHKNHIRQFVSERNLVHLEIAGRVRQLSSGEMFLDALLDNTASLASIKDNAALTCYDYRLKPRSSF